MVAPVDDADAKFRRQAMVDLETEEGRKPQCLFITNSHGRCECVLCRNDFGELRRRLAHHGTRIEHRFVGQGEPDDAMAGR